MQVLILLTNEEFETGIIEKAETPTIKFVGLDGWVKRLNLDDVQCRSHFSDTSKAFLREQIDIAGKMI